MERPPTGAFRVHAKQNKALPFSECHIKQVFMFWLLPFAGPN